MRKILRKILSPIETKSFVRRNFLINCIILTVISTLLAVGSSKYLFKYELPEENFVTLEISAYFEINCIDMMTSSEISEDEFFECEDGIYEIYRTRASGAVISNQDGKSYILTADHFCDIESNIQGIPPELLSDIQVDRNIKKNGKNFKFSIIKQDPLHDLCLIESDGYQVSKPLRLARSMPEIGELTSTISSPLGISERGVSLHFSGTFSGCNLNTCFFTIPAISGSSGSLVLNYDKEIVGMTQRSLVGFPEVTIGVGVYDISEFILEYENESGNDITPEKFLDRFFF